ncbi:hypothetical protein HY947_06425 [Candidatus Gottesmanbacteria bacterium]|nr:hypothetical protein [Candidatus Gottesmanbacteria bacterium]
MKKLSIALVVPTIRSLDFLSAWGDRLSGVSLYVIEDHKTKELKTPSLKGTAVFHFSWEDIRKDFGNDEWIFSRKNAGIRSYGFWKAYQNGSDVIMTLDDDCFPTDDELVRGHLDNLSYKAPVSWMSVYPDPKHLYSRGFPYDVREKKQTVISHGLWSGALDQDARTEVVTGKLHEKPYPAILIAVPPNMFFPMSSMNLAFAREITPCMFFPMMGSDPNGRPWGFDRYDDIWAGVFAKKICDHLGLGVVSGSPFVDHKKASDPSANLEKEKAGLTMNEEFWKRAQAVRLTTNTPALCYRELADKIVFPRLPYFTLLKKAMKIWAILF